jgi:hypothetical protein
MVEATIGGETVSPLSLLPLLLLMVWIAYHLVRDGRLPAEVGPLMLFALLAGISSAGSLLLPIEPYKGQAVPGRTLRGMATLAIGVAFYLSTCQMGAQPGRLRSTLKAVYLGGLLALLWSSVQAIYVLSGAARVPWQLNEVHRLFSVRDLFADRVTGLAYEPSWLGNQLVVFYLPIWLAGLVTGHSLGPKVGRLAALELLLAVWGAVALFLARARISQIGFLIMVAGVGLWLLWRQSGRLVPRTAASSGRRARASHVLRPVLAAVAGGLALFWLARGVILLGTSTDSRIYRAVATRRQIAALRAEHPFELTYAIADRAAFAERLVYWRAGFAAFERYPLLGVGVGNAGFLFEAGLPTYAHRLVEIRRVLNPDNNSFPNTKSLWVRLLAETGAVGTAAFLSWGLVLAAAAFLLSRASDQQHRFLGVSGLLALPGLILEGFSLDTFALPQAWVMLGLVTAGSWSLRGRAAGAPADVPPAKNPPPQSGAAEL